VTRSGLTRLAMASAVLATVISTGTFLVGPAQAAATPDVTVHVLDVSPNVPPATPSVTPLVVTLELTNTSATTFTQLRLDITREPPISSSSGLRRELANPVESTSQPFRLPSVSLAGDLAPKSSRRVILTLATSTDSNASDALCLCRTGVYPLDFALHAAGGSASGTPERGWGQTYIPSVADAQLSVSWFWPLIDRPHRMTSDTTFIDDALAGSVAAGGRLDRSLAALEKAKSISTVTLIIDPELLDELVVMTQGYRIAGPGGASHTGTGGRAAELWLERFKVVLTRVAGYSLTPYADPDADALTRAGMGWTSAMPTVMAQRLAVAVGIADQHDIAWPPGQTVTGPALTALTANGVRAVLLDDATLPDSHDDGGGHVELANSQASALAVSRDVSAWVSSAVSSNGAGIAAMPALVSSALMPALEETNNFLVLAPDRYADVEPTSAAAALDATSVGPFLPISARTAVAKIRTYSAGDLTEPSGTQDAELAPAQLEQVRAARTSAANLADALGDAGSASVLAGFPDAIQRAESAGWRTDRNDGLAFATGLAASAAALGNAVRIVPPSDGSYSLASNDSPLYLFVRNGLPVPISVKIAVSAVGDVKGFTADTSTVEVVDPGSVQRFRIQAHVERSGHFVVAAMLTTPSGAQVGPTERLSIYSKALGTIGVVITFVAGSVLAIALLVRFSRRFRKRARAKRAARLARG
jgi:hypothetical protein